MESSMAFSTFQQVEKAISANLPVHFYAKKSHNVCAQAAKYILWNVAPHHLSFLLLVIGEGEKVSSDGGC